MSLGRIIVSAETPVPAANPDESMINASDDETVVRVTVGEGMIFAFGEKGEKGDKGDKGDPGSSGSSAWGQITGTLSEQTDLQDALNAKANTSTLGTMAAVNDAASDDGYYVRRNGAWVSLASLDSVGY